MKCIKIIASEFTNVKDSNEIIIRRVSDDVAFSAVHYGPWQYATRTEWKADGRKWGLSTKGTDYVPTRKELS